MRTANTVLTLDALPLDRASDTPLYRQLYEGLRSMILNRHLVAGVRLPSTRALAVELEIARATVQNAFEQLLAEGYLQGKVGSGTFMTDVLPEETWERRAPQLPARTSGAARPVSVRAQTLVPAMRAMWTRPPVAGNAFRLGLSA